VMASIACTRPEYPSTTNSCPSRQVKGRPVTPTTAGMPSARDYCRMRNRRTLGRAESTSRTMRLSAASRWSIVVSVPTMPLMSSGSFYMPPGCQLVNLQQILFSDVDKCIDVAQGINKVFMIDRFISLDH
jgi:hypothetical protein